MAAALITALVLSLAGLATATAGGFLADTMPDVGRHATFGVFVTLILLLSYSLTMFYLIGKGRAIREAIAEAGLPPDPVRSFSALRRPVFGSATLAMAIVMAAAIVGAGVDTGTIRPFVHSGLAILGLLANLVAIRASIRALIGSVRITHEVDRQLGA